MRRADIVTQQFKLKKNTAYFFKKLNIQEENIVFKWEFYKFCFCVDVLQGTKFPNSHFSTKVNL